MKPDYIIEKLVEIDWPKLAQLYLDLSVIYKAFFNWTFKSAMDEFEKSESFIIKNNSEIQSFITFRSYPDRLEIMAIGTRPCSSRYGHATQLLAEVMVIAAERSVPVWLEVHENNLKAVHFYLKNHFSITNRRKSYYGDGGSALIMSS